MKTSLHGSYNFQASQKSFQINRVKNSRNLNNFLEVRGSHGQISANLLHSSDVFHLTWRKMILCRVGCRGMFDPVSCLSAVLFFLSVSKDTRMQTCVRILGSCQVPVIEFLFHPTSLLLKYVREQEAVRAIQCSPGAECPVRSLKTFRSQPTWKLAGDL